MTTSKGVRRRLYYRVVTARTHSLKDALALEQNVVHITTARDWIMSGPEFVKNKSRKVKITEDHFHELMHWLHKEPRRTYQQMADYMYAQTQHAYTKKQIRGAFKKNKISRKKIDPIAFQRDEELRRHFRMRLRPPHQGISS